MSDGAAPDLYGWTGDILLSMCSDEHCLRGMTNIVNDIANGTPTGLTRGLLLASKIIPTRKPNGGIRPIAIITMWYKLAALLICQVLKPSIAPMFQPIQFGCGAQGVLSAQPTSSKHFLTPVVPTESTSPPTLEQPFKREEGRTSCALFTTTRPLAPPSDCSTGRSGRPPAPSLWKATV
jgi:hypothetical protein